MSTTSTHVIKQIVVTPRNENRRLSQHSVGQMQYSDGRVVSVEQPSFEMPMNPQAAEIERFRTENHILQLAFHASQEMLFASRQEVSKLNAALQDTQKDLHSVLKMLTPMRESLETLKNEYENTERSLQYLKIMHANCKGETTPDKLK